MQNPNHIIENYSNKEKIQYIKESNLKFKIFKLKNNLFKVLINPDQKDECTLSRENGIYFFKRKEDILNELINYLYRQFLLENKNNEDYDWDSIAKNYQLYKKISKSYF